MKVIERRIQKVRDGKRDQVMALEHRFEEAEAAYNAPAKRRYLCIGGPYDLDTMIWEREWPSLAAMEAAYEQFFSNAALVALSAEADAVFADGRNELYTVWE